MVIGVFVELLKAEGFNVIDVLLCAFTSREMASAQAQIKED